MVTTMDDEALAISAGGGNEEAFRALLERHYDRIYRLAYRFFGNQADAEDIAQEICLALPKKLRSFAARAKFSTWIYQVVLNACRDQSRRQSSRRELATAYGEVSEMRRADEIDNKARMDWLYAALESLAPPFKETAVLVLTEDLNHAQAGEILGVKETTISWRMHEIRKQLKSLADGGEGGLQ